MKLHARLAISACAIAAAAGALWLLEPDRAAVVAETAAAVGRSGALDRIAAGDLTGDAPCVEGLREGLRSREPVDEGTAPAPLRCEAVGSEVRVTDASGSVVAARALPKWTALLPPVAAVILALGTRRLLGSLFAGVWIGAFLLEPGWDLGVGTLAWGTLRPVLTDQFNLSILLFTFALVGMVNVASRAGGNVGIANAIARLARSQRGACTATGALGLVVFFDDYANTQVVGHTMRPLTDRYRVSREKLAFIVDSTAAPVSGLAILSTWIGYEVGLIGASAAAAGASADGYEIFFRMLPFRFYCIFALALVFLAAWTRRDFGPMLRAERRAASTGEVSRPGAVLMADAQAERVAPHPAIRPNAWVAGLPILAVVVAILAGIIGFGSTAPQTLEWVETTGADVWSFAYVRECFSAADSFFVLLVGSLVGTAVVAVLALTRRREDAATSAAATGIPATPTTGRDVARAALYAAALGAAAVLATGGLMREDATPFSAEYWRIVAGGPFLPAIGAVAGSGFVLVALALIGRMAVERRSGGAAFALSLRETGDAWLAGARSMLIAGAILILAWSIRRVCDGLGTDLWVVSSMRGAFDPIFLPAATFLAAAGISFATGTSWGTMGILIPTVLPLAYRLGGDPLMAISTAAVLDGSIFGDHCSPISDTTVLSSIASRCDHLDHVRTQAPYALAAMSAALLVGYLPAAYGCHGWPNYAAGIALLAALLYLAGGASDARPHHVRRTQ